MKYSPKVVLAFFASERLPTPELEYRFHPERKWRFDFAWEFKQLESHNHENGEWIRLALEVQGGIWIQGGHNRGAGLRAEHEKRNEAARLGWRILYVEPKDLCLVSTVKLIKDCLGL